MVKYNGICVYKGGLKLAKDFLKAILEAEENCRNKENEAKKKAEERKISARTDSEKCISDAKKDVEKMLEDDKKAVSKSIDIRLKKEAEKSGEECKILSRKADNNRSRVISMAVEELVK